jgi:hypothetical protein
MHLPQPECKPSSSVDRENCIMQFGIFMALPAPEWHPAAETYQRAIEMGEAANALQATAG